MSFLRLFYIYFSVYVFFVLTETAHACDLCAIYDAQRLESAQAGTFAAGISEQFTRFGSIRIDGEEIGNPANQYLNSSVTQLFTSYGVTDTFALQLTLPVIDRVFKRVENGEVQKGSEFGIGDASISGNYVLYRIDDGNYLFHWSTRAGLKLPTGDASRIKEEAEEGDSESASKQRAPKSFFKHSEETGESEIASAVHGHDLALGSGSFDYIFGSGAVLQKGRWFATLDLQYALRTEGEIDYRYANDFVWSFAPGNYLYLDHDATVALKANLSGETKGMDRFRGESATDTGITTMFLGPELVVTAFEDLSGEFGVDFPLLLDNTELQSVPDFRIRASLSYRF